LIGQWSTPSARITCSGARTHLVRVTQWQIEAFRRFEIPPALVEKHGYAPLTRAMKEQISAQRGGACSAWT